MSEKNYFERGWVDPTLDLLLQPPLALEHVMITQLQETTLDRVKEIFERRKSDRRATTAEDLSFLHSVLADLGLNTQSVGAYLQRRDSEIERGRQASAELERARSADARIQQADARIQQAANDVAEVKS